MAGAAPKLNNNDSEYQDHSPVVACPRSVILALRAAVLESFTSGPHGGAEVYGILFGTHAANEVQIRAFQTIAFQSAMAGTTSLSQEERGAFAAALAPAARANDAKPLEPVGWFRAHPHSELSLTARDLEIASTFFPAPHQVEMIMRPSESLLSLVRIFYRESAGTLKADSPYCEFNVQPAFEASPMVDVPAAREAQTGSVHSQASAPPPARPPAPPSKVQPALPAPIQTPVVADDVPEMLLLEPPPLARKRINMLWLLVLVTALGSLVAWYWLARPAEQLALRFSDTGGQLRIMWEPVPNGEAGNLEIMDGGGRYTITLSPDQLRSGAFTYTRRSANVNVRLEAFRQGTGPLAEAASFHGKDIPPVELNPPPSGSASREAPPKPFGDEKPAELVVSVNVPRAVPPAVSRPKFSVPAMKASSQANPAPDLAAPPLIAQSAPAPAPALQTLGPPIERPAPPKEQPAAIPPAQAAVKPGVTAAPPRALPAPASGRIIWIGRMQKNQELEIIGTSCSTGTLIGELPRKPVKFSVSPGDLSNDGIVLYTANPQYANNVTESPGPRNGWNKTTYTWNPKYANDVTVKEAPAAQNQWSSMVLHSKNPKISVVVIDWALVN